MEAVPAVGDVLGRVSAWAGREVTWVPPADEIANTLVAAQSGVGAAVVEVLPDVPALVLEFIPGRTLGAADVRDPALAAPIAAACRRLHPGARFGNDLLAENFILESQESVRIIDHQLSGNNDPAFELGDIAAEADFDPDQTERLATAYFGPGRRLRLEGVSYVPIALLIVIVAVAVLWFADGRKDFTGMRRNIDEPAKQ